LFKIENFAASISITPTHTHNGEEFTMKAALLLTVSLLMIQGVSARERDAGRGDRGGFTPINQDELPMCLKKLNNVNLDNRELSSKLNSCQLDLTRALDRRNDNEVIDLRRENADLRRQIEDTQNERRQNEERSRNLGNFSYAGCLDYMGKASLKTLASGEARSVLEAETNALKNLSKTTSCTYGQSIIKTEPLTTTEAKVYCVAGCLDYMGNLSTRTIQSARGRNQAEAEMLAIQVLNSSTSCTYGAKIKGCE
jgi:hypothetical protein